MASTAAVKGGTGATSTPANNVGGRTGRRPSQEGNGLFAGLMSQKRNSVDEGSIARRLSLHETQAPSGVIGKLWHNYTRGAPISSKNMSPPPNQIK